MMSQATFGGGCFWCTEAIFQSITGVLEVESGYSGGATANPTYNQVSTGKIGHAEVIQVSYDPAVISYEVIIKVHLATHNPTTLNQQGIDKRAQYRSIIFYSSSEEKLIAQRLLQEIKPAYEKPILTEIQPYLMFYPAKKEHQNYYQRNSGKPYCQNIIDPKLAKFRQRFPNLVACFKNLSEN